MSSPARPPQVTFAAGIVIGGSVFIVLSVFQQVSGLQSLQTRESVETFLAEPPGSRLDLTVADVLTLMRVLAMVAAACAVSMAILGIHALKRSRSARLALTVLAVPLVLTGLVAGGLLSPVVTVAVVMLWLQPARDWFDGIAPRPAPERRPDPEPPTPSSWPPPSVEPTAPTAWAPTAGPGAEPRAYTGFGTVQPSDAQSTPYPAYGAGGPSAPARRPGAVLWACVLTWTLCGLVVLSMVLSTVVVAVSPDLVMDELRKQQPGLADDLSEDLLVRSMIAMTAVLVLWCAAAAVVAWFAFRRARWAQVTLLVSAALAGAFSLFGTLVGSFPLVLTLAACVVASALLLRPEVRAWYAARGSI